MITSNEFTDANNTNEENIKISQDKFTTQLFHNELPRQVENASKLSTEMIDNRTETHTRGKLLSPILTAISNFNLAKKLHRENLEHNPLPDTVTDRLYRKIQIQRQKEPGLSMQDKHFATGKLFQYYNRQYKLQNISCFSVHYC